jgi:hypothetical protein
MRMDPSLSLLAVALMIDLAAPRSFPASGASQASPANTIACRALEVHTDARLGVTIVVFHQRDDADRERVGALLRAHHGAGIEFRTNDGASHPATVMRLKSCFGRGLLVFSSGAAHLAEKDNFLLSEPRAEAH